MSHRLDDPAALSAMLQQWSAPPEIKTRLEETEFTTLGLLGHALPSPDKEDSFITTILGSDPNNPALLHSASSACLRRLLTAAQDMCPPAPSAPASGVLAPSGSAPAMVKPSPSEVQALRQKFQASYPGELLTPEAMPAPEFLSALQHTFASGASPWLPWRARCTEADAISWHDSRCPRSDRQLLRTLLEAEEEATAFVPQSGPVEPTVRKALSVFATALAMLDKVHLLAIKRFNDKFLSFALAVPSDGSLRGPSLQEILAADRAVWQAIHSLIRDHSWSLSDSLNEVAFCRQDIPSALQPRPRAVHVPNPRVNPPQDPTLPPPPSPGGNRRKRTKSGHGAQPGRPKAKAKSTASASVPNQVPAAKAFDKTWHKKINGVEVCMRGALGRCTDPNCPRSHLYPVPLANGKPCAQKHTALEHLSTKH